jgi:putative inorganic carbon (HCO3(-)) transporter
MERLVFGYGTNNKPTPSEVSRLNPDAGSAGAAARDAGHEAASALPKAATAAEDRRDWAYLGLMIFTAVLFFRPQDLVTSLRMLPMAEIAALFALAALIGGRLGRGLPLSRTTPELLGVLAFALCILGAAPFSVWIGGAIHTFTDLYSKVVLIFVLMVNTLTSPRRIEQFTWLIVVASGYIAGRTVLDYARGINLIENGRVQGAVGGMFKNPNDLALNMVAVMPLAGAFVFRPISPIRRGVAALAAILMLFTVVATQSRAGTVGLVAMVLVLAANVVKRRPGVVFAAALAAMLALPLLPSSYWQRMASITDKNLDQTGSREARSILLRESYDAFLAHPLTGVGAGQFQNYNPDGRQEPWRESHNVVLQVAAELGIGGLIIFGFLIARGMYGPIQTRRLLRRFDGGRDHQQNGAVPALDPRERELLTAHAEALSAALAGWFVCALFASVAYHWTFYYLLALATVPRDYLRARLGDARLQPRAIAGRTQAAVGLSA